MHLTNPAIKCKLMLRLHVVGNASGTLAKVPDPFPTTSVPKKVKPFTCGRERSKVPHYFERLHVVGNVWGRSWYGRGMIIIIPDSRYFRNVPYHM